MWKKNAFVLGSLLGALALAGCGQGSAEESSGEGLTKVSVRGLSASQIASLVVTAQPANVTKTLRYDASTGLFTGRLLLPSGPHVLTARGYGQNPSQGVVASGAGTVNVVGNSTTAVTLRVHDQTPPQRQQDIAPMIRSVSATKADLVINEPILVTVDAVDLDGDALSYAWSSDCPNSTFTTPSGATTAWASNTAGSCTLQVKVSSRNQNLQESVNVLVYSSSGGGGEGGVDLGGEYVSRPLVDGLHLSGPGMDQSVWRDIYSDYNPANFAPVTAGQQYSLRTSANFGIPPDTFEMGLDTTCGTVVKLDQSCDSQGFCYGSFTWTAPASGSVCKLTGFAINDGLRDNFSVGVLVR